MENELQKANMEISTELFSGSSGFEGVDSECVQTPYLKLAQDSTDERKKQSPKYIQGLDAGMFFCPSSRKIYGDSFLAVPLRFYRAVSVYQGKGPDSKFKGIMDVAEFKRDIEPNGERDGSAFIYKGLRYVDTRNFIVVPYDHMEDGPMLFTLSSTGITPSRKWISAAMSVKANKDGTIVQAPLWSSVWKLSVGYFDSPNGSYYQLSSTERLSWVDKKFAPALKSMFDDAQSMSIMSTVEQDSDHAVTKQAEAVRPADIAEEAVKNVFGSAGKEPDLF